MTTRLEFLRRLGLLAGLATVNPKEALSAATRAPLPAPTVAAPPAGDLLFYGPLVASGGLCAPLTPYYQLTHLSVSEAFPEFKASRGVLYYKRLPALKARA